MKLPVELTQRLQAGASETLIAYLTTSLRDGRTDVLPIPFTDVVGDLVLLPDLFAMQSRVNLNENAAAVLSFATAEHPLGVTLEGQADLIQWGHPRAFRLFGLSAGEVLDRWGDWDETVEPILDAAEESARPTVFAQRGVIVFKPERIVEVLT